MAASGKPLNISKQRYIFALMRREVRWVLGPIYLATGIVDAIYRPDLAPTWIALRAVFVVVLWFAIWPLRSKRFRERYSNHFAIALTALAANIVNFMIYQSGGIHSFYHIGVILTIFAGVQVFRLTQAHAFYVSMISYSPTILINIVSAGPDDVTKALVHSTFLVTLTSLTYVMRFAEERDDSGRAARTLGLRIELEKLRRTEFLKKHFPPELRARVESGAARLERRRIVESAVVGFVDITSSTAIANRVDIQTDWEFKEAFLEAATKRATQCGLIVLTHVGDGFLFMANYDGQGDWESGVLNFFDRLLGDFKVIEAQLTPKYGALETGIKCGIAVGSTVVGFIGNDQSYFTAMGPEVNLASRLVALARNNEMVVSSRAWWYLRHLSGEWETESFECQVKGFSEVLRLFRIVPRARQRKSAA